MKMIVSKKSSQIRALAAEGVSTADIARQLGIGYGNAYQVLKRSGLEPKEISPSWRAVIAAAPPLPSHTRERPGKPPLPVSVLVAWGLEHVGCWTISPSGELMADARLPNRVGV